MRLGGWVSAAAASLVTAGLLGGVPKTAQADTVQTLQPAANPVMAFPDDLAVAVDDDGLVAIDVPAGLQLAQPVAVTATGDRRLWRGSYTRSGDRLVIRFPAGFEATSGAYRFFPTGSSAWPGWKLDEDFTVRFSTTIDETHPAGPLMVRATGTIRTQPFTARAGEPHTVQMPAWAALNQAADTSGSLLAAVVSRGAISRGAPAAETAAVAEDVVAAAQDVSGNAFNGQATFTLPASLPLGDWPGTAAAPRMRLTYPGRNGVESVQVTGALGVTERVRDRVGLARVTPDGALVFLLPRSMSATSPVDAVRFGRAGDVPFVGDWDGDGTPSVGVYRPSQGTFLLGSTMTDGGGEITVVRLGRPGDVPLTGRFGVNSTQQTVAVYRPSTSSFILASENEPGGGEPNVVQFGSPGDVPLLGHWNRPSRGPDTIGVFRPSDTAFHLASANVDGGGAVTVRPFGRATDTPFVADLNGDGYDDPLVRRGDTWLAGSAMGNVFPQSSVASGRPTDTPFTYTPADPT